MKLLTILTAFAASASACGSDGDSCYGPIDTVEHVRQVKRMQAGVPDAAYGPKRPLEWGQVNFLHTTDTHGWLAGHLKEQNYGADWGDFVTFTRRMRHTAGNLGVDLILIDTGDLHDGAGLSDATTVDGTVSMPIFSEIDYDLLTIGNHELYVTEVALQMFNDYATKWGDRYVTSNVKVFNETSNQFEHVGATHRYWTTPKGLRVMAYGVLYDFAGNSNVSQVIKAKDMVQEPWFLDTLHSTKPVDLFILTGHNPVRKDDYATTLKIVWDAIRKVHPHTPIQLFGGHSHIRDFQVYDDSSVGIESGRYCETLGWVSMTGFSPSTSGYRGVKNPHGVKNPTRKATTGSTSPFVYSRRYLDWNRKTFAYHTGQDEQGSSFDFHSGLRVTAEITKAREELRLGQVFGCAPRSWCIDCVPFDDEGNIFPGVIEPAAAAVVVNEDRKATPRIILGNTGGIRFDLPKGPFTYDDNFVVSPFRDAFLYIADVPYGQASQLISKLNAGSADKRSLLASMPLPRDICTDPTLGYMSARDARHPGGVTRRQQTVVPGYVTEDDFGSDGDDTKHSDIPSYQIPGYWESRAGFPTDGSQPDKVDVIFFDFIQTYILGYLGEDYTKADVQCYLACDFTSQDFLAPYAKMVWQDNIDDCPL